MRGRAFAKINLSLRVLGTRPDGYHELRTIFQSIALHDTLTVSRTRRPFTFTCDDPQCRPDRANLVWRAAEAVWAASHRRGALRGASIRLAKRIPMQAGLGGGSSDAAATIQMLGRLWNVPERDQRRIGAELGADVPYFFEGGTALGTNRGDRIERLPDHTPAWVVLAIPAFGISSKEAFGWFDADRAARTSGGRPRHDLINDLEAPVVRRHPQIGWLVERLSALGAVHASMTGSGSTVFGLFSRQNRALDAASDLFGAGFRTVVTRTIGRRASHLKLAAK